MASAEAAAEGAADGYGSLAYWDARYEDSASTLFDWYQDYEALAQLLLPLLRPSSRVLHLGCGNSPLPEALYDAGFKDVTSVDYSAPAVEHMRRRNAAARPELRFEVADARNLSLAPAAYDLVIDKGLLDAMLCCGDPAAGVAAMVSAVRGALSPGGAYACVSFGAPRDRLRWLRGGVPDWGGCEVWSLPKPRADAEEGSLRPTRQRDGDAEPAEGTAHFVYLLTAPGEAAAAQQQAPAEAPPAGGADAAGAEAADAGGGAARWAF